MSLCNLVCIHCVCILMTDSDSIRRSKLVGDSVLEQTPNVL